MIDISATDQFRVYSNMLHSELVCASGCTEPASIAYCCAKLSKLLTCAPDSIHIGCSANIIKNVRSVAIPNSGNLVGIEAAAILGALVGSSTKADNGLEIFTSVDASMIEHAKILLDAQMCTARLLESSDPLHIRAEGSWNGHRAVAELRHTHTNMVYLELDGKVLLDTRESGTGSSDRCSTTSTLNIKNIIHFAEQVNLVDYDLDALLEQQITCNSAIAREGMLRDYGSSIGRTLLELYGDTVEIRARSYAAAGSDARMSGCELPVVVNSGSGNQGITVTLPVVQYAKELGKDRKTLKQALIISNLVAIHIKESSGRLSAFCGVVSAAAASGAAITWLHGGSVDQIGETISNTLANISGIVCDGAKASCAAKIATSVEAAILGHRMSMKHKSFRPLCGIVGKDVEATVEHIGTMVNDGMKELDETILGILLDR